MEAYQEFLRSYRPQHFAAGAPLSLLINTLVMWLVVNKIIDVKEKVSLLRCAICAALLYVVSGISIALLLFPTPLVFILSALVWLIGSYLVIQSTFELTYQGGGLILIVYLILLIAIHRLVKEFVN